MYIYIYKYTYVCINTYIVHYVLYICFNDVVQHTRLPGCRPSGEFWWNSGGESFEIIQERAKAAGGNCFLGTRQTAEQPDDTNIALVCYIITIYKCHVLWYY